ncbi:hypothetical protein JAO29_23280, partial [Edaphobacter sp. HDX4]
LHREPLDVSSSNLAFLDPLVDVGGLHVEVEACHSQQFAAARRYDASISISGLSLHLR